MKRINENSKVTLTLKQLKGLVKESRVNEGPGAGYTVEMKDITLLNATATVADGAWKVKGDCRFIGHAQGYDWSTEELEYEGQFEFHVNTHQINKYVEKYLPEWDPEDVTEEDIKEMLERTSAYSIEDISQMIGAGWLHVKWDGVLEVEHAGFDLDDRYLGADDADAGNFDIQLYDKGSAPEGDCNNCYFSIEAHDDFALDVETAYDMKDEEGEPLDEETERSTNKWGVFLGGELKQAFDDFDEAAAWADDTWPDDDRVEIRELDDDEMYEIDQDQDMTCCKCGEPVKRMFAHTLGNDVYCDDCFRDAARHHRLSYEGVSVKESDSENEVIANKKDAIRTAKARIDELYNIIGMALEEIEEVEGAIDSGEINGQDDEKGYLSAPEHLVQTLTELRSAVVDISDVKSELNNALISICNGFRMNHGSIVHGMRTRR